MRRTLLSLLAAPALFCAEPQIQGPTLGYFLDSDAKIRPAFGELGSAQFGDAFEAGMRATAVSTKNGFVLGLAGEESAPALVRIGSEAVATFAGARTAPDRMVLSPSGSAVLFYYASDQKVETFSTSGDLAKVSEFAIGAEPRALAVSDDGLSVAVAGETVQLFHDGGDRASVPYAGESIALQFRSGSSELVFAADQVALVSRAGDVKSLGAVESPSAIAAFGRTVIVASATRRLITTLSMDTAESRQIECSCEPDTLSEIRSDGKYRLNGIGQGAVWVLDLTAPEPRIAFIPGVRRNGDE